jgi:type IV secretion system protein VirB1
VIVDHALALLLARCAPDVGPLTMTSLVAYESGARPYAIGDNTARRSYFPSTKERAKLVARALLLEGHDLDLGIAQINVANLRARRFTLDRAFDPCQNAALGARILVDDYLGASREFGRSQTALVHALSAYNSGGYWAGLGYAAGVAATARNVRFEPEATR